MRKLDYKQFSERHRPHIHPPGGILFVTYRLAGSIPKATVREYKARKEWLYDQFKRSAQKPEANNESDSKYWLTRLENFNRQWFIKFEDILHTANLGPTWLIDANVANLVAEGLHKLDGEAYRLDAYSVMSNHVHTVFKPLLTAEELKVEFDESGHLIFKSEHPSLSRIMQSLKGSSARNCNLALKRTGQFWERESFDHVVREGKYFPTIAYVLNNPVKAGLVQHWRDWRWNFCREGLSDKFQ